MESTIELCGQSDADKPLAIDLFCGLGGWAHGLLAEGWRVIGFDIEAHCYDGERYPAQLVLQDVATLHGSQFRSADLIVSSSPCQEFSYRAMPWKRAKALPPPVLGIKLFEEQFRIQREACEAAGRHIPLIVENVRGAQKWVGRSRWNFGSYHLWGDVPALMPMTCGLGVKVPGLDWKPIDDPRHKAGQAFNTKRRTAIGNGASFTRREGRELIVLAGIKQGGGRFHDCREGARAFNSKDKRRKQYAAAIAKIPFPLAQHIGRVFRP